MFFSGDWEGDWGADILTSQLTPPRRGQLGDPISPHPRHPTISPHIDEDALEGVYFAFSTILWCLPYFFRKTRPRASYELLEAFLPSLTADGASVGLLPTPNPHSNTPSHTPTSHTTHLTPHRRGCHRRALFRVFDHTNVFALLFAISPS